MFGFLFQWQENEKRKENELIIPKQKVSKKPTLKTAVVFTDPATLLAVH